MARRLSIHEFDLRPGVSEEDFERYYAEEIAPLPNYPGWETSLMRIGRGECQGRYALLIEVTDVEQRDRYYPSADTASEEAQEFDRRYFPDPTSGWGRWESFATTSPGVSTAHTDYVVLSEGEPA